MLPCVLWWGWMLVGVSVFETGFCPVIYWEAAGGLVFWGKPV